MSGHSKWHSIKHKKGIKDAKRAKAFTQLARAITVAARSGGDPNFNFSLRLAIDKAKAGNVPKDNIERALKKGTGEIEGEIIENKRYEGYGPHGVAFIVDALTDNSNRTVSELKHLFSKHGGNLGGSVSWQFSSKGIITVPNQAEKANDETFLLEGLDHGVEDLQTDEQTLILLTEPAQLQHAREWLQSKGLEPDSAELAMLPNETMTLDEAAQADVLSFIDLVEEQDDVENVFHNLELT